MPYIGKAPLAGDFKKLGSLTASATATYALTYNSAAFKPANAESLIVSVNGVTQAPVDAYSVSGSNIIFSENLSASDTIDYILALGEVGNSTVPANNSVTTEKLSSTISRGGAAHIRVNPNSLTVDTTIASGENALVAGPFTLSAELTVNGTFTVA
tara:strand:+ start:313 stop:780 length:468 start_codon:yes stop_codon:yes gene_type:complete